MMPGKNEMERICSHCNKSVLNTEFLSDDEVLFLLTKRPETEESGYLKLADESATKPIFIIRCACNSPLIRHIQKAIISISLFKVFITTFFNC